MSSSERTALPACLNAPRRSRCDRLSGPQVSLGDILLHQVPVLVGLQHNGCHAAFYEHKKPRIIRIMVDMKADRLEVVTFYMIDERQMPVMK